jgi:hypothetical protein
MVRPVPEMVRPVPEMVRPVPEISPYKLRIPPVGSHDREDLFFDVSF